MAEIIKAKMVINAMWRTDAAPYKLCVCRSIVTRADAPMEMEGEKFFLKLHD